MGGAVAARHKRGVFCSDIKPENSIVKDGCCEMDDENGEIRKLGRVVVNLTEHALNELWYTQAMLICLFDQSLVTLVSRYSSDQRVSQ